MSSNELGIISEQLLCNSVRHQTIIFCNFIVMKEAEMSSFGRKSLLFHLDKESDHLIDSYCFLGSERRFTW